MSIFRKKDVGLAQTEMKRHLTLRDVSCWESVPWLVQDRLRLLVPRHRLWLALPWLFQSWFQPCVLGCQRFSLLSLPHVTHQPVVSTVISMLSGGVSCWMGGWLTMIVFMNAVSSVASGWGAYLKGLLASFGLKLPQAISGPFNPSQGTYIDLLPVLVLVLVTALLLMNSKQALRLNSLLVVLKFSAWRSLS